jgi:hypothetical protein
MAEDRAETLGEVGPVLSIGGSWRRRAVFQRRMALIPFIPLTPVMSLITTWSFTLSRSSAVCLGCTGCAAMLTRSSRRRK